jgi:hypothetical protein
MGSRGWFGGRARFFRRSLRHIPFLSRGMNPISEGVTARAGKMFPREDLIFGYEDFVQ